MHHEFVYMISDFDDDVGFLFFFFFALKKIYVYFGLFYLNFIILQNTSFLRNIILAKIGVFVTMKLK